MSISRVGTNSGHGHVWNRPDGKQARCGGPDKCVVCEMDLLYVEQETSKMPENEFQVTSVDQSVFNPQPELRVKRLHSDAIIPTRGSEQAVGYDLSALVANEPESEQIIYVLPSETAAISTGIAVAIPPGHYGRVAPRSGLAVNQGIDVLAGVIDPDYRGEVKVVLHNTGYRTLKVTPGMRIAQLILEKCSVFPVTEITEFEETARGDKGFGSTGV